MNRLMTLRAGLALLSLAALLGIPGQRASAVQILPNPNPSGNTISIPSGGQAENQVLFSNLGAIDVDVNGTLKNLAPGTLNNSGGGQTHIQGTFINEGIVGNNGFNVTIAETGRYVQRENPAHQNVVTGNAGLFWKNEGRVRLAAGEFLNLPFASYTQTATGKTWIDGATFQNLGFVGNSGAIRVGETGRYEQGPGSLAITNNDRTFANAGRVELERLSRFTNTATGVFVQQGTGTTGIAGTFENSGRILNAGSTELSGGGLFLNREGAQYEQRARGTTEITGFFHNLGHVVNAGTMKVAEGGEYGQSFERSKFNVATVNSGTFDNAGRAVLTAGSFLNEAGGRFVQRAGGTTQIGFDLIFTNNGRVVNSGIVDVTSQGQVTGTGRYVQRGAEAQTIVNGTFGNDLHLRGGTLSGFGTVTGAVIQTGGVVQPGFVRPGVLTLAGGLAQGFNGRLDFKIGGLLAGSQYSVLNVTGGSILLNGRLSVALIDGFKPGLGNRFDLLACTQACTGFGSGTQFKGGLSLPSLSSELAWVTGLTNIGNGIAFSLSVVSAVSAPEPGTALLIGSGFVGLIAWRRRGRLLEKASPAQSARWLPKQ